MYSEKAIQYARDIVDGNIVSCENVQLACRRFLDDLERSDWEWEYQEKRVEHVCSFMEMAIKHLKGPLANQLLVLEPWQCFVFANMYGWVNEDGTRRFQNVIVFIARKNGKSLFASACAIYELIFGESGGEIYSIATKQDQARICWEVAKRMISIAPTQVKGSLKTSHASIWNDKEFNKYIALGRDSKSMDGLNPSFVIFDEAAAYSDRNLIDVITSGQAARSNFTNLFITTAQFSKSTVYFEYHQYLESVLKGKVEDERIFGVLYSLDKDDDWMDESVWEKANPNWGVSVIPENFKNEFSQSMAMKSKRNSFLVKNLNIWSSNTEAWIDTSYWTDSEVIVDEIPKNGKLFVSFDLSMSKDLATIAELYVAEDGKAYFDYTCYLPQKTFDESPVHVKPIYHRAIMDGKLILCDLDVVDYSMMEEHLKHLYGSYECMNISYDPWNANQLVTNLEREGIDRMFAVGQGISHLSDPSKHLERLVIEKKIYHKDDPFFLWQLENCTFFTDRNNNIKVQKGDDPHQKIDSVIALIMAVSAASDFIDKTTVPVATVFTY